MERRPAQRPFRIRIQILVGALLSQHGASDMPVEPSPLMLWSELLIQIFETVAQREYLVRWVTEQFHSAADERHGDLVGRSEEHTSELQSLMRISYAVFCLKKKTHTRIDITIHDSN